MAKLDLILDKPTGTIRPNKTLDLVTNQPQPRAAVGGSGATAYPYSGASYIDPESENWFTWLWSPDNETNPMRDVLVARLRDLVRNNGWASGIVSTMCDSIVGQQFRMIAQPDYHALEQISGNKAFDSQWADEFRSAAEAAWRTWSDDPNRWCDKERRLTFTQMIYLGLRHKLIDGDCIAVMGWHPEDVVAGKARYATRFNLLDPDLLANPQMQYDTVTLRGGVEINGNGVAQAYWFRNAHPGNWFEAAKSYTWTRIERETSWGRPTVIHDYDHLRAGQHRGGVGVLTPILLRFRMLDKYDTAELQAAVLQATLPMYVESPQDPQMMQEALGDTVEQNTYNDYRIAYHQKHRFAVNGAKIPLLFPGEKIGAVAQTRPHSNFDAFEQSVLRSISACTGLSAEQVTHDYSKTNYSSNRAAMIESWKTLNRRRQEFIAGFARPIYACWLEEAMDKGELPLPKGNVPSFGEMRTAYSACDFIGPGKGNVDPTKEISANILALDAGITTLKQVCAENGDDWEEILEARAIELAKMDELGITRPAWSGVTAGPDHNEPQDVSETSSADDTVDDATPDPAQKTITAPVVT